MLHPHDIFHRVKSTSLKSVSLPTAQIERYTKHSPCKVKLEESLAGETASDVCVCICVCVCVSVCVQAEMQQARARQIGAEWRVQATATAVAEAEQLLQQLHDETADAAVATWAQQLADQEAALQLERDKYQAEQVLMSVANAALNKASVNNWHAASSVLLPVYLQP